GKLKFSAPTYFYVDDYKLKPDEIRDLLAAVSVEDLQVLGVDALASRPEWLVLSVLLVPPVNVRPSITLESGERSEDAQGEIAVDVEVPESGRRQSSRRLTPNGACLRFGWRHALSADGGCLLTERTTNARARRVYPTR
ncbi:MAG: hypothetical protein B7Z73_15705, partial [Planctomycetia bacterium 21-64-5]